MSTLWVHCGSLKTASSHIQNAAYAARTTLLDQGWLYPTAGLVLDEPDVGYRHSRLVYLVSEPDRWQAEVDRLVAEIKTSRAPHVLLSSEAWSKPSGVTSLHQLIGQLRSQGVIDEVRGTLYLRNRVDYARGVYREMTRRRGNQSDFKTFVGNRGQMFDPLTVVSLLSDEFAGNLDVRNYDQIDDVARDFFARLGLEVPLEDSRSNLGWDAVRVAAQRHMSRLARGLETPPTGDLLPGQPPRLYGEWLSPDDLSPITDTWREDFTELTGWPADQIAALVGHGKTYLRDVHEVDRLIGAAVEDWLIRQRVPALSVTPLAGAIVWDAQAGFSDPLDHARVSIAGRALLTEPIDAMWWIPEDRTPRSRLTVALPSPGLAQRHPELPHAAHARFEGTHLPLRSEQSVAIVAEVPSGMIKLAQVEASARA